METMTATEPATATTAHKAQNTLVSLPHEVLLCVASACEARDIEVLGATCAVLYAVARDPLVWRRLFERDYAHLYERGVPAMPWPCGDRTTDPWPEFAAGSPEERADVAARLPPRDVTAWAPMPFARMGAEGKDARWLYIAHARRIDDLGVKDGQQATGTVDGYDVPNAGVTARMLYRGDVEHVGGKILLCGYGVGFVTPTDSKEIAAWREGSWSEVGPPLWSVYVTKTTAHVVGAASPTGARPCFEVGRLYGKRRWYTTVDGHTQGRRTSLHTDGSRGDYVYDRGELRTSRFDGSDGSVTTYTYGEKDARVAVGGTRYANGDITRQKKRKERLSRIIEFCCSDACPDPRFAGRRITGVEWRWEKVYLWPTVSDYAIWPVDDSESARLFCAYVAGGFPGWAAPVQAVVLARIQGL